MKYIREKENGDHEQVEIDLPSQKRVEIPVLLKHAQINTLKVQLFLRENRLVVVAPVCLKQDLITAQTRLLEYFKKATVVSENISGLFDNLAFDIMLAYQSRYLSKVITLAKEKYVTIRIDKSKHTIILEGTQPCIDYIKRMLQNVLEAVTNDVDTRFIPVNTIQAPFLETDSFDKICNKMMKTKCVLISVNNGANTSAATALVCTTPSFRQADEWMWLNDSGQYQHYDTRTAKLLTAEYSLDPSGKMVVIINGTQYRIDFGLMEQMNTGTLSRRQIILQNTSTVDNTDCIRFGWFYKLDHLQWESYLPHHSLQLEVWYKSQQPGLLVIGKFNYSFDFARMEQTNVQTEKIRGIKRVPIAVTNVVNTHRWSFQDDDMQFRTYTASDSLQLEEWYQSSTPGRLTISGKVYRFDFGSMTQVNMSSGKFRKIKREAIQGNNRKMAKNVEIKLQGYKDNIHYVKDYIQAELIKCLVIDYIDLPKSVNFSSVKEVSLQHPVECTLALPQQVKIKGIRDELNRCKADIQNMIIANLKTEVTEATEPEVPKHWQTQTETLELFQVQLNSSEWVSVAGKFMHTMRSATIIRIERIQNKWLWQKYSHHKEMLRKKNKNVINEMQLFHGTRSNDPNKIYNSEEGFDMRYCDSGMWGKANYFAVNATYSDNYAHTCITGRKKMFLVSVLTGESYECQPDSRLRMPPEKQSTTSAEIQLRYDTVTGNTNGSKIYMTYDNLKAYPSYLITYHNPAGASLY